MHTVSWNRRLDRLVLVSCIRETTLILMRLSAHGTRVVSRRSGIVDSEGSGLELIQGGVGFFRFMIVDENY